MKVLGKKIICFTYAFLLLLSVFSFPVHAVDKVAKVYNYSNLGKGGSDIVNSSLLEMGLMCEVVLDIAAPQVRQQLQEINCFVYIGHGQPGILICNGDQQLSANSVVEEPNNFSLQAYYGSSNGSLQNLQFVYLGCCHSDEESPIYGRLTTYFTETLGAQTALGFSGSVFDEESTYFETMLFHYLNQGNDIQCATDCALGDLQAAYYETYYLCNVSSVKVYGDDTLILKEAQ